MARAFPTKRSHCRNDRKKVIDDERASAGQVSALSARIYAEVTGCDIVAINDTPATMLRPTYFQEYVTPNLQPAWQVSPRG